MSEDETLARVREDVQAGHLPKARQRLRGLFGTYPQRLDLRAQLAELYRREGLVSQAGRWSYLGEEVDPAEVRAFEREYADPVRRMKALGWRGPEEAAGEIGRARLESVRLAAERSTGHELNWGTELRDLPVPTTWGDRIFGAIVVLVIALLVLGGIAFVVEGVRLVVGWLTT